MQRNEKKANQVETVNSGRRLNFMNFDDFSNLRKNPFIKGFVRNLSNRENCESFPMQIILLTFQPIHFTPKIIVSQPFETKLFIQQH